jgi:hypothetical protein
LVRAGQLASVAELIRARQLASVAELVELDNQCFHNRLFKNPFTISKIPFSPQNFLATHTVEKIKKIQTNLRQMYHRPYEKSSIIDYIA